MHPTPDLENVLRDLDRTCRPTAGTSHRACSRSSPGRRHLRVEQPWESTREDVLRDLARISWPSGRDRAALSVQRILEPDPLTCGSRWARCGPRRSPLRCATGRTTRTPRSRSRRTWPPPRSARCGTRCRAGPLRPGLVPSVPTSPGPARPPSPSPPAGKYETPGKEKPRDFPSQRPFPSQVSGPARKAGQAGLSHTGQVGGSIAFEAPHGPGPTSRPAPPEAVRCL